MNTDAVICIALTRTRPSWTPLLRTISWIFGVMLRKSIRAGMLKVRYSVCDFMMTGLPRDRKEARRRPPFRSLADAEHDVEACHPPAIRFASVMIASDHFDRISTDSNRDFGTELLTDVA